MKTRKNGCFNSHPRKALECVRGVHSFVSACVAPGGEIWTGQTVFLLTDGGWPVGVMYDRHEAEKLVNEKNLALVHVRGGGIWRIHPFTVDAEPLKLLAPEPRTLETDLHEDR